MIEAPKCMHKSHDMHNAEAPSSREQGDNAPWKKQQILYKVQTTQCSTKYSGTKVQAQMPQIGQGQNNAVFDQVKKH